MVAVVTAGVLPTSPLRLTADPRTDQHSSGLWSITWLLVLRWSWRVADYSYGGSGRRSRASARGRS